MRENKEEIRCSNCNRLLFIAGDNLKGTIEVKCERCGDTVTVVK